MPKSLQQMTNSIYRLFGLGQASVIGSLMFFATIFSFGCMGCSSSKGGDAPKNKAASHEKAQVADAPIVLYFHLIRAYCGGAAPTEEMERERAKGEAYANSVWYVGKNISNCKKVTADENGQVKLNLEKGKYFVYGYYKIDKQQMSEWRKTWKFNEECLQELLSKPDFEFEVGAGVDKFEFVIFKRCSYEGPIPCVINQGAPPP